MPNKLATQSVKEIKLVPIFKKKSYKKKGKNRTKDDVCPDENGLSITIDGITFTIICKSEADQGPYLFSNYPDYCDVVKMHELNRCNPHGLINARDMVCFTSSALPGVYLYAYRSSSELGIWRLAYVRNGDCGLFKGDLDYVQGTSIHHCLMKLIDENWDRIPDATDFIPPLDDASKPCHAYHQNERGKLCLVPPFITKPGLFVTQNRPEKDMIDDPRRRITGNIFDRTLERFDCGNKDTATIAQIWGRLTQLGQRLQQIYELGTQKRSHTYKFDEDYANIHGTVEVWSVELNSKDRTTNSYTLIYSCYTIRYGTPSKTVKGAYGIALLPKKYSVNNYGIYTQYVNANVFICKPFFYKSMCHYKDTAYTQLLCHTTYLYVGFIFDCWPYNQLCGGFSYGSEELQTLIQTISEGSNQNRLLTLFQDEPLISNPEVEATIEATSTDLIRSISFNGELIGQYVGRVLSFGGNKSHKKGKTQKKRTKRTKRKTQKRRPYSIFRSNK
jgi:hypothetical protein